MDSLNPQIFLRDSLQTQARKVASYDLDGRRVWIKAAGPAAPYLLFRLLGRIIRWLGLAPLRPFNNHGGSEAIDIESERLRSLGELGVRVPRLLASTPDGLLIEDLGGADAVNLHQALTRCPDNDQRLLLLRQAIAAIASVHAKGTYLSQAFARNMVFMADGELGFIDFEEDPGRDLSLPECQARDLLCLIFSVSLFFTDPGSRRQVIPLLTDYLRRQTPACRTGSLKAMRRLAWLRHLPGSPAFGKDTVRAQATGAIFHDIIVAVAP
ncbi:MAG: hypothetical protein VW625_09210 [Perlucidibaca sp.]